MNSPFTPNANVPAVKILAVKCANATLANDINEFRQCVANIHACWDSAVNPDGPQAFFDCYGTFAGLALAAQNASIAKYNALVSALPADVFNQAFPDAACHITSDIVALRGTTTVNSDGTVTVSAS